MKRTAPRKLEFRADTVRVLRPLELATARGGAEPVTPECPSAYTYCAKYCSD